MHALETSRFFKTRQAETCRGSATHCPMEGAPASVSTATCTLVVNTLGGKKFRIDFELLSTTDCRRSNADQTMALICNQRATGDRLPPDALDKSGCCWSRERAPQGNIPPSVVSAVRGHRRSWLELGAACRSRRHSHVLKMISHLIREMRLGKRIAFAAVEAGYERRLAGGRRQTGRASLICRR